MQNFKWTILKEIRPFTFTQISFATKTKTHYEILHLKQNCTAKEIRDAFVKLSKKHHPDVSGADKKHTTFVQISEAYQVLSKPKARDEYDRKMRGIGIDLHMNKPNNGNEMHRSWEIKPDIDPNPGPYYGFKNMGRISNSKIVMGLAVFTIFGAILSFFAIRNSVTFKRQKLDEHSADASIHHASIRANAEKYGNQEQLRRIVERMIRRES